VIQIAGYAQDINKGSERNESTLHSSDTARQDTNYVKLLVDLANHYKFYLPDSALFYGYKAATLARQINFPAGEVAAFEYIIITQVTLGNDSKALEITLRGLKIAEKNNLMNDKALFLCALGHIYSGVKNYTKALNLFRESKALYDSLHDFTLSASQQNYIGETYLMLNQPDSALYYCQAAYENAAQLKVDWAIYGTLLNLRKIQLKKDNIGLALAHFRQTLLMPSEPIFIFDSYFSIAGSAYSFGKRIGSASVVS
jgi:two-component system NtrC family sensor kinase